MYYLRFMALALPVIALAAADAPRSSLLVAPGFAIDQDQGVSDNARQRWLRQREVQRQTRQRLNAGAKADREVRATKSATIVSELLGKAAEQGVGRDDPSLSGLITGVRFLHAPAAEPLAVALAKLPEHGSADAKALHAWTSLVESRREALLKPTMTLSQEALKAGIPFIARDCLDQILVFTPDHRDIRRNLGETLIGGRWYGPRTAELAKLGLEWDAKLGWIVAKDRARYAAGDYFEVPERRWTTLEKAEQAHLAWTHPWVMQTEHLEVRGTAKLVDLVDTANRLEQFYDRIFAAYAGFFVGGDGKKASDSELKLLFGMLGHPRLVVNVARDLEDYQRSLPPEVDAGWSAGMFIPSTKQSYFYAGYVEALYHEFTHQILDLFSDGDEAPAWLVEGAAVYTETPVFVDGAMVLGDLAASRELKAYFRYKNLGKAVSIDRIMAYESHRMWMNVEEPGPNYATAGMVVMYAMEAEGRRYRADFIDYLRDSYRGQTQGFAVWDYLGIERDAFIKGFPLWVASLSAVDNSSD